MAQSEARVWWADVQHLRDEYERTDEARRRADQADLAARRAARERRRVDAEVRLPPAQAPPPRRRDHVEPARPSPHEPRFGADGPPQRRIVEIRGRTVPAPPVSPARPIDRRRRPRPSIHSVGPQPDRMALWALLLGVVLILVAVGTAHAAPLAALTI